MSRNYNISELYLSNKYSLGYFRILGFFRIPVNHWILQEPIPIYERKEGKCMEHESLVKNERDPLITFLNKIVVFCVKCLAVLTVLVIMWGLVDVIVHLYLQFWTSFSTSFEVETLISTLGIFLAVLIAIEIFLNIVFYLKKDAVHVPLVLATALTAVARKVIVLDYSSSGPEYIYATAAVIFAVGVSYWLITKNNQ